MAPAAAASVRKSPVRTRRSSLAASASTSPSAAAAAAGSRYSTRRASVAANGNGRRVSSSSSSSSSSSKPAPLTKWGVLLYLPNIIGYLRVAAALYSLYLGVQSDSQWPEVVGLYFLGFALDAVDGHVARLMGQESKFGAVLDMVTDRTATAGLVMLNMSVEEDELRKFGWIVLVMLDIGSHWAHCMSVKGHHKSDAANRHKNLVLRLYYASKPLFLACCLGQETFYLANYVIEKDPYFGEFAVQALPEQLRPFVPATWVKGIWWVSLVLGGVKQVVNVAQLCSASAALAEEDAKKKNAK